MSVLLLILKIILIILAVILATAIFLLNLILFVPICYKIKGEKYDEIVLDGNASWLLGAIKLRISFQEELKYSGKVFWKTIFSSQVEEPESKKKSSSSSIASIEKNKINVKESKVLEKAQDKVLMETDIPNHDMKNKTTSYTIAEDNKKINGKKKFANKMFKKGKIKKKKVKKEKVKEGDSKLKDIFNKIQAFLKEDSYKGVVKFAALHGWKMIKSILPRKIRLHLQFGTNDPAVTGYILGVVSIFYAVTGNSMVIEPDFEKKLLKGSFDIKGRIFIFILVYHALKIILDKRVKKLIAEYNH